MSVGNDVYKFGYGSFGGEYAQNTDTARCAADH